VGDATQLSDIYAGRSFDRVLFSEFIGAMPLNETLAQVYKVLKPSGRILISIYPQTKALIRISQKTHFLSYSTEEIFKALLKAGYTNIIQEPIYSQEIENPVLDLFVATKPDKAMNTVSKDGEIESESLPDLYRRVVSFIKARIVSGNTKTPIIERKRAGQYFIQQGGVFPGPVHIKNTTYGFTFGIDKGRFILRVDDEKGFVQVGIQGGKPYWVDSRKPLNIAVSTGNIIRIAFADQEIALKYENVQGENNARLSLEESYQLSPVASVIFKDSNGHDMLQISGQGADDVAIKNISGEEEQLFVQRLKKSQQSQQLEDYLQGLRPGDLFWYGELSGAILKGFNFDDNEGDYWGALSYLKVELRKLNLSEKTLLSFERPLIVAANSVNKKDNPDTPDLHFFPLIERALILTRVLEFLSDEMTQKDFSKIINIPISSNIKEIKVDDDIVQAAKILYGQMSLADKDLIINKLFEAAFANNWGNLSISNLLEIFTLNVRKGWGEPDRHFSRVENINFGNSLGVDPEIGVNEVPVREFKRMLREQKIKAGRIIDLKLRPEIGVEGDEVNKDINNVIFSDISKGGILYRLKDSVSKTEPVFAPFSSVSSIVIHPDAAMVIRQRTVLTKRNVVPGGIDLNTTNGMQWKISRDGRGVEMNIDPARIEQIRREGIGSLSPVILQMTPVSDIWSLVGLSAPVKG
jgi:hypothetical protein